MNWDEYQKPAKLERLSFLWSQVRLLVAALALLLGGIPPILYILRIPALYGIVSLLLRLSWIISGIAAGYLLYRWIKNQKIIFGGRNRRDIAAFAVSVVSGLNLGITGLMGINPGMTISSNYILFVIVAVLYLLAAYHLHTRWKESGKEMFTSGVPSTNPAPKPLV